MPAKSRKQFRLMEGVARGSIKLPGLSPQKAAEYIHGQSPKGLPERVSHRKTTTRQTHDWRIG
jgi:hypothetical protein